ncbi:MAG: hypothetical protein OXF83_06010 [Anaerolineaceae bacterium]|nr:hypothetical protein [Anaerolineaceae bacterium]
MKRARIPRIALREPALSRWLAAMALSFFLLILAVGGFAQEQDRCHIHAEQHVRGNFYAFCERLQLDGRVDGVLIVTAVEAEIRGSVGGDVYLLATRLDLHGELAKDLHFAGGVLEIHEGASWQDENAALLAATLHTRLQPNARLTGDYLGVGYQLLLDGRIDGSVEYDGARVMLGGVVSGDVRATVGDATTTGISQLQPLVNLLPLQVELWSPGFTLAESGRIAGDLHYRAPRPAELDGVVGGQVLHDESLVSVTRAVRAGEVLRYWRNMLREFVVLAMIATGVWLLAKRPLHDSLRHVSQRPLPSFGVGLLTFILSFPIALLVALVSALLLLPLNWLGSDLLLYGALLVGMVDFGLASLFYFAAVFLSRVVAAVALGRWLYRRYPRGRATGLAAGSAARGVNEAYLSGGRGYLVVLLGCLALALLSSLPYAGWVCNAFAAFFGLGAIVGSLRQRLRILRLPPPPPARYETTHAIPGQGEAPPPPPPIAVESWRAQPGMTNLPPGFRWWEESEEAEAEPDGES